MPQPLRVAVVSRAVMPLHGVGGLERSVRDLVRHLADRGVVVTLIVPPATVAYRAPLDPFASPRITIRPVRYVTFPFANRSGTTILDRSTAYLFYGWRAGRLARQLAATGQVDIVHGFGASVLGAAGGSLAVPLVLNPQGLEEFGATALRQTPGKRAGYAPLRWAVRRVARAADRIIATDHALEPMVARHLRPRPDQVVTIPNGIDLLEVSSLAGPTEGSLIRQRHGISPGELVLLSVGRLEHNKGLDLLASAVGRAARPGSLLSAIGWRWVIVGAGPFRSSIESAVRENNIDRHTLFTGRSVDSDLHAWYEAASIYVHPTRYEGSSLVTLEAMAHRRPVIATRAGGLPDKVRPGVNGWLVEPDSPDLLAAALEEMTAQSARLPQMGAESRRIVEQEFAWPVLVQRQIALYEELIELHARTPSGAADQRAPRL
ncbi:MAG: glycosyltransferase family 4 protein [Vicinamibacterales bacterium]